MIKPLKIQTKMIPGQKTKQDKPLIKEIDKILAK